MYRNNIHLLRAFGDERVEHNRQQRTKSDHFRTSKATEAQTCNGEYNEAWRSIVVRMLRTENLWTEL